MFSMGAYHCMSESVQLMKKSTMCTLSGHGLVDGVLTRIPTQPKTSLELVLRDMMTPYVAAKSSEQSLAIFGNHKAVSYTHLRAHETEADL
eukprot:990201-Amphidinium_carterae.1